MNKQIKEMRNDVCVNCHYVMECQAKVYDERCGCMKAVDILYNAGYRKQEWIGVEERLPERDEYVMCYSECDCVFVGYRGFHSGAWMNGGIAYCGKITHWMPLPEPPTMNEGAG